jgi:hypothetical protein
MPPLDKCRAIQGDLSKKRVLPKWPCIFGLPILVGPVEINILYFILSDDFSRNTPLLLISRAADERKTCSLGGTLR